MVNLVLLGRRQIRCSHVPFPSVVFDKGPNISLTSCQEEKGWTSCTSQNHSDFNILSWPKQSAPSVLLGIIRASNGQTYYCSTKSGNVYSGQDWTCAQRRILPSRSVRPRQDRKHVHTTSLKSLGSWEQRSYSLPLLGRGLGGGGESGVDLEWGGPLSWILEQGRF